VHLLPLTLVRENRLAYSCASIARTLVRGLCKIHQIKNKNGQVLYLSVFHYSFGYAKLPPDIPKKNLSLEDVIGLAQEQSLQAILARHRFRGSYWQYRTHVAKYLPSLSLSGELIDFNRSLIRYQREDGTYTYVEDYANAVTMAMNLQQNIGLTGDPYMQVQACNVSTSLVKIRISCTFPPLSRLDQTTARRL